MIVTVIAMLAGLARLIFDAILIGVDRSLRVALVADEPWVICERIGPFLIAPIVVVVVVIVVVVAIATGE